MKLPGMLAAVALALLAMTSPAQAVIIEVEGSFDFEFCVEWESGPYSTCLDNLDGLTASGSFSVQSPHFNERDFGEVPDICEVVDFFLEYNGQIWDETVVPFCECVTTA